MNPRLKKYLVIFAKNAVNALLTNGGLGAMFPKTFNFHDPAGMLAFLKASALVVLIREGMVWGPVVMKWSTTNVNIDEDPAETKSNSASAGK